MLRSNSFKAFLATFILAATTSRSYALSAAAERADLNSIAQQVVVAGNIAIWVFAFMGLMIAGIGVARILSARSERRKEPPTQHYRYFEGVWRILVGLGLIVIPVCATFIAPAQVG